MRGRLRRDLCASTGDGLTFSLMVGAGETYDPAFALALGLGELTAGWVVSLPMLAGASLQLVSPRALRLVGSHKRWVVLCAGVQAMSFVLYAWAALRGELSPLALYAIAALYWGAGLATGPAWNAWIGAIVPPALRPRFFAKRNRFAQAGVLAGILVAGISLQHAGQTRIMTVFALLFAAAGTCRLVSTLLLVRQRQPSHLRPSHDREHPFAWLRGPRGRADGRLLVYMLAVQVAMQISGPFFTPYMLAQLEFSYTEYLVVIATSFAAKAVMMPTIGALAARIGPQRLLHIAGIGIVPLSLLWLVSGSLAWLIVVQIVAGTVWATYELCTFLLLFEHISESRRTSVLTGFNFANAVAMVAGSLTGGALLQLIGPGRDAYFTLFIGSSVLRAVSVVFLFRLARVAFVHATLVVRPLAVRPNSGAVDVPIVASIEPGEGDAHTPTYRA